MLRLTSFLHLRASWRSSNWNVAQRCVAWACHVLLAGLSLSFGGLSAAVADEPVDVATVGNEPS
ncbi:MAG: hypothetical protein Q8M16_14730, partial [Pirellulaceae bacterium]|nr:hypothetical protein [Pirellulaceae bacterium]